MMFRTAEVAKVAKCVKNIATVRRYDLRPPSKFQSSDGTTGTWPEVTTRTASGAPPGRPSTWDMTVFRVAVTFARLGRSR